MGKTAKRAGAQKGVEIQQIMREFNVTKERAREIWDVATQQRRDKRALGMYDLSIAPRIKAAWERVCGEYREEWGVTEGAEGWTFEEWRQALSQDGEEGKDRLSERTAHNLIKQMIAEGRLLRTEWRDGVTLRLGS